MSREILQAKETLIFLLPKLVFARNIKKPLLTPVKKIELVGITKQKQLHSDLHNEIKHTFRKNFLCSSCCSPREDSKQALATATNSSYETNKFISDQNKVEPRIIGRTKMVELRW